MRSTVNAEEIAQFNALAKNWWDERGPMKPLHEMNPVRLGVIKRWLKGNIKGQRILDVGCGGGIVCEPLARLGAKVTGIDAAADHISVATAHAHAEGLAITYKATAAESLLKTHAGGFDCVLALEIIEHVDNPALFVQTLTELVKPGGTIIISTLNRTPHAFALGIVGAEYILGWLPRGTHDWRKFVKPSTLGGWLAAHNTKITDITGVVYDPLRAHFKEDPRDIRVNYMLCATRKN